MFEMDKCREEFEKLPGISTFLPGFKLNEATNEYERSEEFTLPEYTLGFFNGAWYAFQHQQAKVEELQTLYTQQGINMLKMQKRLEELESLLEKIHRHGLDSYNTSTCLTIRDELEQALKGEG